MLWDIYNLEEDTEAHCGGLNVLDCSAPQLEALFGESYRAFKSLLEKVCIRRQALRVYGLTPFPGFSLCVIFVEDEIIQLPALASY